MASTISAGTTSGTAIAITGDTSGALALLTNNGTTAMTITTAQAVGIGTATPSGQLSVKGANGISAERSSDTDRMTVTYDGLNQFANASGANNYNTLAFTQSNNTNSNERMRIDSSGNVLIGTTSTTTGKLNVVGTNTSSQTFAYFARSGSSAVTGFTTASNGYGIYTSGIVLATEFNATSDARLKENIQNLTSEKTWQFINNVTPVSYNWKTDENKASKIGFIAQNIISAGFTDMVSLYNDETVVAETIDGVDCPDKVAFNMNYDQVIPILTKAIQELNAKVDAQAAEIQALKGVA